MVVAVVAAVAAGIFSLTSIGLSIWGTFRTTDLQGDLDTEIVKLQGNIDASAIERKSELQGELNVEADRRAADIAGLTASFARRSAFLERQLDLYFEAAAVLSKIATAGEGPDKDLAVGRFRELYWGELAVVEDAGVQGAMVEFRVVLDGLDERSACMRQQLAIQGPDRTDAIRKACLRGAALSLAHAARASLEKSWATDLGPIEFLRDPQATIAEGS